MNLKIMVVGVFLCLLFVGCRKDDFILTQDMVEIARRQDSAFPAGTAKKIHLMRTNDVILAVNGYPLTKQAYDDLMELKLKSLLKKKGMSELVAQKLMDDYRVSYIKTFIGQRLLVDHAFAQGVATTNEILSEVENDLKDEAQKRGKNVSDILAQLEGKERYFLYEVYVSHIIDRVVSQEIPPKSVVDETFISAVQKQIDLDNKAAESTNNAFMSKLAYYKEQIESQKLDFLSVVKSMSGNPKDDGIWGEFEEVDFDNPVLQAKVFSLKEGEISDVIEDESGLQIVKVLKITPAVKDENGRVVEREKRQLAHIYIAKIPTIIRQTDLMLTSDLKHQMQLQALNEFVTGLSTNSATKIEYPNGKDLF